jgi:hypothetical protein
VKVLVHLYYQAITNFSKDYSAHSNYCELALRELGFHDVFPHTGHATEINLRGKQVFPIVTGTFGAVDFLHSGKLRFFLNPISAYELTNSPG